MKVNTIYIIIAYLLLFSCNQTRPISTTNTSFPKCLSLEDEQKGKNYKEGRFKFEIQFPEHWHVKTDHENGISASDTLVKLEDYQLISITAFKFDNLDYDKEVSKLITSLKDIGKAGNMKYKNKILQQGKTKISGHPSDWILVEDEEITNVLGDHARVNYLLTDKNEEYFYNISVETYGANKMSNLCHLKKIVNTFKITI